MPNVAPDTRRRNLWPLPGGASSYPDSARLLLTSIGDGVDRSTLEQALPALFTGTRSMTTARGYVSVLVTLGLGGDLQEAGHPKLSDLGPRSQDIRTVLNACASILDAMLPVRNQASVAHPNAELLGEAEARLVINVGRTLLHYLDAKLS